MNKTRFLILLMLSCFLLIYRYDFRIDSIFYDEYFEYTDGEQSLSDMSKDIQKKVKIYLGERT